MQGSVPRGFEHAGGGDEHSAAAACRCAKLPLWFGGWLTAHCLPAESLGCNTQNVIPACDPLSQCTPGHKGHARHMPTVLQRHPLPGCNHAGCLSASAASHSLTVLSNEQESRRLLVAS